MIVIAMAAVVINGRGRKNHDDAVEFTSFGAMVAATSVAFEAAFADFFLPVPEPFAMANQIRPESKTKVL